MTVIKSGDNPPPNTKKYIITFKRKDQRQNQRDDKTEIIRSLAHRSDDNIWNVTKWATSEKENVRYYHTDSTIVDIDRYETPIVIIHLTDEEAAAARRHPDIKYVENDAPIHQDIQSVPWGINAHTTPPAWDLTKRKGKGVNVAILDSGIDTLHPDLRANCKGWRTFVPNDPLRDDETGDDNGHGTHVAGSVAAVDNTIGVVGQSPQVHLYALRILQNGSGDVTWKIPALEWINANKINLTNASIGSPANLQAVSDQIDVMHTKDKILVASAGNNNNSNPNYPASYTQVNVFGISAIDEQGRKASFSNFGNYVDFAGAGVAVYSTIPNNGYGNKNGTSMASPNVCGIVALAYANWKYDDCRSFYTDTSKTKSAKIRSAMINTADKLGGQTGWNQVFGWGRPNTEKLVKYLLNL